MEKGTDDGGETRSTRTRTDSLGPSLETTVVYTYRRYGILHTRRLTVFVIIKVTTEKDCTEQADHEECPLLASRRLTGSTHASHETTRYPYQIPLNADLSLTYPVIHIGRHQCVSFPRA